MLKLNNLSKREIFLISIIFIAVAISIFAFNRNDSTDSTENQVALALAYKDSGYYEEAAEVLEQALAENPDIKYGYNLLGNIYQLYLDDHDKAIDAFKEAIKRNPDDLESYYDIGNIYYHINNYGDAEKYYKAFLEKQQSAIVWDALGNLYTDMNRFNDSFNAYDKGLELNPLSDALHNDIGALYASTGDSENAESHYRRALQINPNNQLALQNLARLGLTP